MTVGFTCFSLSGKRFSKVSGILALGCLGFLGAVPLEASAYDQVGRACWYGPRLHGRITASGEIFNQNRLTAAHQSLPFGTRARVTNLDNGKTVQVRINDRGPHVGNCAIDISRAAAKRLDMIKDGNARVRIQAAGR